MKEKSQHRRLMGISSESEESQDSVASQQPREVSKKKDQVTVVVTMRWGGAR